MSAQPFSIEALPLDACAAAGEPRVALIEASAGTGKTYTLCGLYARYVAERGCMPDQLLVVTFTDAAAAELSQRIRERLRAQEKILRAQTCADAVRGADFLRQAVARFDEAAIHTMHGFCQKLLRDFSFECGGAPEADIVEDAALMMGQSVDAFWRQAIAPAGAQVAALAAAGDFSREFFLSLLSHMRKHPQARLLPESPERSAEAVEAALAAAFGRLKTLAEAGELGEMAERIAAVPMKKDYAPETIRAHAAALRIALRTGVLTPTALAAVEAFVPAAVEAGLNRRFKKAAPPDVNEFSRACGEFSRVRAESVSSLARGMIAFAEADHRRRAQAQSVRTYDDLIDEVYAALRKNDTLARALRARYRAAMIDEFQDTDALQWGIFGNVFGAADGPPLWLIGDPKQAIYRFRGADIFTYLKAAKRCGENVHVLVDNYRSSPRLIAGLNALFALEPNAFLNDRIRYHPVHAASPERGAPPEGFDAAPIQLYASPAGAQAWSAGEAHERIARAVAGEIAALLKGGVSAGDIAVLVRKSFQAQLVAHALEALGIVCVARGADSVFQSAAADVLEQWFALMDDAGNPSLAKRFAFGVASACLAQSSAGEALAGPLPTPQQCARWQELWRREGIAAALDACARQTGLRAGALAAGQTRLLTDWAHLSQLLAQAQAQGGLSPEGLRAWFVREKREAKEADRVGEDMSVRIDNDAVAVRVQTVHLSKGLEYPIVFCPFHWGAPARAKTPSAYTDEAGEFCVETRPLASLPSTSTAPALHAAQELGEEVRLLYVALTRAKSRLYVYWPNVGRIALSQTALGQAFGVSEEPQILPRLRQAQAACAAQGAIALHALEADEASPAEPLDVAPPAAPLWAQPRVFAGKLPLRLHSASFSSLTHGASIAADTRVADYDADAQASAGQAQGQDAIAAFPQGASAGVFFHDVFERADYQAPGSWPALMEARARLAGLESADLGAFEDMFARVLSTPLGQGLPFCLRDVRSAQRLHELGFCLPGQWASPAALARVFAAHAPQVPGGFVDYLACLPPLRLDGFLSGSVDVIFQADGRFWVADWKSNRLGANASAYTPQALQRAMTHHAYYLQYHLYVCVADAWLRARVPGYDYARDFGGVFYVFVRGVQSDQPGSGVYFDRPSPACVRALQACLAGKEAGA